MASDAVRCYPTAGGRQIVRHDTKDEGLYFDVPANEVAYGNLAVTEQDDRSPDVGGMLTWADFTRGVYGGQVHWAKWTIHPANAGAQPSQAQKPR
jgi:hypothetical protein